MVEATSRQRAVLEIYLNHERSGRAAPTIREIGEALGIRSTNGVNDHLKALERKGLLAAEGPGQARSRKVTAAGRKAIGIADPIFSVIACGRCNRLSVAINGQALSRHNCGVAWKELRWEYVDLQMALTALRHDSKDLNGGGRT